MKVRQSHMIGVVKGCESAFLQVSGTEIGVQQGSGGGSVSVRVISLHDLNADPVAHILCMTECIDERVGLLKDAAITVLAVFLVNSTVGLEPALRFARPTGTRSIIRQLNDFSPLVHGRVVSIGEPVLP